MNEVQSSTGSQLDTLTTNSFMEFDADNTGSRIALRGSAMFCDRMEEDLLQLKASKWRIVRQEAVEVSRFGRQDRFWVAEPSESV
ncbi:unnamed protein product [Pieris macdunnoughi]|uniref:Uncharacterized protein n=1 Tax=Pieris macdunnoughi TaxID=345717 RepID=A0A821QFY5_9NEOP|nr:unnamed protein product [Pieris macdunnoughi]